MTIFNIDRRIEEILSQVNPETGEIEFDPNEIIDLQMEKQEKLKNVAIHAKEQQILLDAMIAEKKALEERIKQKYQHIENCKEFLLDNADGKFEYPEVKMSYWHGKNQLSISCTDKDLEKYFKEHGQYDLMNHSEDWSISKTKIKEALQSGKEVPYCRLEDKVKVVIK